MKRILLNIAYDGTNYCGWQAQPNGITIEEVLNRHLSALLQEPVQVIGASRTDSGVHALGNVAVFDTNTRIPPEKIAFALNQRLPEDIRIQGSREVAPDFHPRKQNSRKTYEYRIWNSRFAQPLCRLYSYFVFTPLNVKDMQKGASYLVGEHDFASFCSSRTQVEDTVRTIYDLSVTKEGNMITIRVAGNGFLYNMVRIIAGTLIRVGQGMYPPERVKEILDSRDRAKAGQKAPAQGLTMMGLEFEETLADTLFVENEDWSYMLFQKEIPSSGKGHILIRHCKEADFIPTMNRLLRKLRRDGAREIYAADLQGRLSEGLALEQGIFRRAEDGGLPQKTLEQSGFSLKKQEINWFLALDTPESV